MGVLFVPPSDAYVKSFLCLLYTLIKLYYTKALSDPSSSLAPDCIRLLWRPRIPMSYCSATTFQWVITPSWLSGSCRSFLYSYSVYSCHLLLILKKEFIGPGLHLRSVHADHARPPLQWTLNSVFSVYGNDNRRIRPPPDRGILKIVSRLLIT